MYVMYVRSWIEGQSTETPQTSSCEMVLAASQPNWICSRSAKVVERINIPLVKADIEGLCIFEGSLRNNSFGDKQSSWLDLNQHLSVSVTLLI